MRPSTTRDAIGNISHTTAAHQSTAHAGRKAARSGLVLRILSSVLAAGCVLSPPARADAGEGWTPVDAGVLDKMRGGFITVTGLEVSLGIERLVTLNGNVVAHTRLEIADVARLTEQQARQAHEVLSSVNVVQSGHDNMAAQASGLAANGATLVQNSLNGQQIDTRTVINSSVNSSGLLTSLNFLGSLSDAIARSALAH